MNIVSAPMSYDEARSCVDQIAGHIQNARILILDLYERRGWEALGYTSWRECVTSEFQASQSYMYRQLAAAMVEREISPIGEIGTLPEGQLRELARLEPEAQREVWQAAVETAPEGRVTAAHVRETAAAWRGAVDEETGEIVDVEPAALEVADEPTAPARAYPLTASNHISASDGYDGDEWYTPAEYVEAARRVMGGIDLDPASTPFANETVRAEVFYTKADDGLQRRWFGRVFCNPPYSYPKVEQFTARLIAEYETGNVPEAILLVNNSTDTDWFQALLARFPACFTDGRVRFYRDTGEYFGTRQGQAFFYAGPNRDRFMAQFARYGVIVEAAS